MQVAATKLCCSGNMSEVYYLDARWRLVGFCWNLQSRALFGCRYFELSLGSPQSLTWRFFLLCLLCSRHDYVNSVFAYISDPIPCAIFPRELDIFTVLVNLFLFFSANVFWYDWEHQKRKPCPFYENHKKHLHAWSTCHIIIIVYKSDFRSHKCSPYVGGATTCVFTTWLRLSWLVKGLLRSVIYRNSRFLTI